MKKINILYWVFNGLFGAFMLFSALPDIVNNPEAVQFMNGVLGYPLYFIPFIGVLKTLGVIAILVPGFHKIKEWAYAGFFFDLVGATYSVYSVGSSAWVFNLIFIGFLALCYYFYTKRKKMQDQVRLAGRPADSLVTSAIA
ncbi:DoxX family protein [Paraflavitalea sp. CAU 1676]|uniref:DoxX family protein n=1 Tax=Paraflavitalea sp. CAU 1676 TaxID=3032598 RepID=UPI0023DA01B0|nr:DoxX family protein [Paraflavitalea sp. CAU 1676]MDF2188882.1 DoxX family protein [Paraflavitalea sp. CAU 1676]